MRHRFSWVIGPVACVLSWQGFVVNATPKEIAASSVNEVGFTLDVLLVNDADFPPITQAAAKNILDHARKTFSDKFSFSNFEFRFVGEVTAASFIQQNLKKDNTCMARLGPYRVRYPQQRAVDIDPKTVKKFLTRWSVESLRAFFPESERSTLADYDVIARKLLLEFDKKVNLISSFKLKNGESLLDPLKLDQRSYVAWVCAVRAQNQADLILTNAFILYDLASEPYPHSIFAKCKMGGASLLSPARRAIYRRAMVASTFSMITDLEFFQEKSVETLKADEKLAVIGTFILAHELGHAIFKMPDFYDHPKECLMTTKYETGYVSGFREIKANPGSCKKCQTYVEAKKHIFSARLAEQKGHYEEAIAHLKTAIRQTPKHVDGNYLRYLADLSLQIAENYVTIKDFRSAQAWLKSTLKIVPKHEQASEMQEQLNMTAAPVK